MANGGFTNLPILLEKTPSKGFRRFHLFISTPLVVMAAVAAFWGDETSIYVFILAGAISTVFELLGRWADKAFGCRYEIDAKGVRYRKSEDSWFEPLSSYAGVAWCEEVVTGNLNSQSVLQWRVELRHRTDPERTVKLLGSGLFTGDKDRDRTHWRTIARLLELPTLQSDGIGVDIAEVSTEIPAPQREVEQSNPQSAKPDTHSSSRRALGVEKESAINSREREIRVRRSGWAWVLPLLFTLMGVIILFQEVTHEGIENVLTETGHILYVAVVVLTLTWGWTLTTYRIRITGQAVTVASCICSYAYSAQSMDRAVLREVVVHSTPFQLGSVSLQAEDKRSVVISTLSHSSAKRVQHFVVNATVPDA